MPARRGRHIGRQLLIFGGPYPENWHGLGIKGIFGSGTEAGSTVQRDGLYERETEMAALSQTLAAARAGTGSLVVVEGPAGIGKSRLLAETREMADALGMTVLTARGIDLERDASFGVASGLFAATLAGTPGDERARLLSGHASLAAALFDPAAPPAEDPSALVRGLYWLTVNVMSDPSDGGDPAALLIEVDDAQWADRPSLSYLAYLAARIEELPAALVIAVRSGEQAADQQTLGWLRDRPGDQLLKPRALRADRIAPTADSVSQVRSLLPDSVLHSVLVRLARLGEPAERLAKAVAVLGDRAPMRQARLLAGLDAEPAEKAADALAGAHILVPGEPLRFTHSLIATSVYADIPAFARARAHRRAADLLTSEDTPLDGVAAHLLLTRPDGDQQTVATLREAAARALTRGEHEAAAHAMEEALALLEREDPALPPLLVSYLTATTFRAGLYPLGAERLRPVIEAARDGRLPDDPGLLAHLVLRLAFAAEPVERIRALAERATAADPLVDPASLGILTGLVVQALCCVDELDDAERICESALAAARRRGSLLDFTMTSYHRAIARFHRGELDAALADLDQALVSSREGWTAGDPWPGSLRVHIHVERGDLAAARDALTMTAGASPGSMELPIALFARARLALAEERPDAALADAEAAGDLLGTGFGIDHPGFVPWQRTAALAAHALGKADRARALAGELLERARWSGTARALGLALRTQAAVSKSEPRLPLLAEAAEVLARSPSALERAHALVELGAARRHAGQRSAAEPPLREGLQLAHRMGATSLVQVARRELRALGLRPRRLAVTGPGSLTPTERRVAELAASGLTNRRTAEALFVTVKTVETHLARAYQKLGISTRAELIKVIGAPAPVEP